MDKYIIENKSGTLLSLPIGKNHLKMKPKDRVDLCKVTGLGAEELDRHPQVVKNRAYNNIIVVEKEIHTRSPEVSELSSKLEKLIDLVGSSGQQQQSSGLTREDMIELLKGLKVGGVSQPASQESGENVVSEEDRLREELLRRQAETFDPQTKNTGTFGKNTQSIEVEDMSDLLGDLGD